MPKKKPPEPCMFCGEVPCQCDGQPTKQKSKRSAAKAAPVNDTDLDFSEQLTVTPQSRFRKAKRDLSYLSALRIVRDIVAPEEQEKIDAELATHDPALEARLQEWKMRNGRS